MASVKESIASFQRLSSGPRPTKHWGYAQELANGGAGLLSPPRNQGDHQLARRAMSKMGPIADTVKPLDHHVVAVWLTIQGVLVGKGPLSS